MPDLAADLICPACARAAGPLDWRCPACGGPLELAALPPFRAEAIETGEWSLWRYAAMLPVQRRFSLGEGMTPLATVALDGDSFLAKLEYLQPTGSYKDRGVAVVLNALAAEGVTAIVEDSSGNAGASAAAYAGAGGIRARVFVPATAPENKKRQIARFGATLVEVPGSRAAVTQACESAAEGAPYASHAWSPYFLVGQMTGAWELWEQLGRQLPDAAIFPVGQGGLLLGWYAGFRALLEAGLIARLPRLFGVQAAAYDAVVRAWEDGAPDLTAAHDGERNTGGDTIADGIRIARPVRGSAILAAIRSTGGAVYRLDDDAIRAAQDALARRGLYVEPTSATPVAALPLVRAAAGAAARIVIPLTGSGLKAAS